MGRRRSPRKRRSLPNIRADLHIHTDISDGRCPPGEVLKLAAQGGLDLISITDHDALPAIKHGWHQVDERWIYVIAGSELTGMLGDQQLHILVYFPGELPATFKAFVTEQTKLRARRYETARERLNIPAFPPASEKALRGEQALTTHHLARELVALGHSTHIWEAISFMKQNELIPKVTTPAATILKEARAAGGVPIWAHPPFSARDQLPVLVNLGLRGLESQRPRVGRKHKIFKRMAKPRHLLLSGGSDWHGWHGVTLGGFSVDAWAIEGLLRELDLLDTLCDRDYATETTQE